MYMNSLLGFQLTVSCVPAHLQDIRECPLVGGGVDAASGKLCAGLDAFGRSRYYIEHKSQQRPQQ